LKVIYRASCPNCGGSIDSERLELGLPCRSCLPKEIEKLRDREQIANALINEGTAAAFLELVTIDNELKEFSNFFRKVMKKTMWSIQRSWARRLLQWDSFAIVAPTGVGKTTLLIIYALYRAIQNYKIYIIVPTKEIAKQIALRMNQYVKELHRELNIVAYLPSNNNERQELLKKIQSEDVNVLITTAAFLAKNYNVLKNIEFDIVIADDFDAILRKSKSINKVLNLLGFSEELIKKAFRIVTLRSEILRLRLLGFDAENLQKLVTTLNELEYELKRKLLQCRKSQLIVASATGRSSSLRSKVIRELLGFEVGGVIEYMRRVVDAYTKLRSFDQLIEIVKALGSGGLIFVSRNLGSYKAREILETLKSHGIKAGLALSGSRAFEKFKRNEIEILVGVASYYGILVRGIDEPLKIKYAIFLGVPSFTFKLSKALLNPRFLLSIVIELRERGYSDLAWIESLLFKILKNMNYSKISILMKALINGKELEGYLEDLRMKILMAIEQVKKILNDILKENEKIIIGDLIIKHSREWREPRIVIPDVMTYIQASGRTSRLLGNAKTYGLSIILVDDEDLLKALIRRLERYVPDLEFRKFEELNLDHIKKLMEDSRRCQQENSQSTINTYSALLIVESPTKARTIASMFGKPARRVIGGITCYEVPVQLDNEYILLTLVATRGHITDLVTDEGIHGVISSEDNFIPVYDYIVRCASCGYQIAGDIDRCPRCSSYNLRRSSKIITALRKLAQEVDKVFIGTDPDMEGEKIAYDIYMLLKPYNNNIFRIEFHEITRRAILKALANPRSINFRLVEAQIVRRIDDRWTGFEISTWLQQILGKVWLGAGRVQSPVLLWIVDRYRKYKERMGYWIYLELENGYRTRLFVESREEADNIVKKALTEGILIENIEFIEHNLNPKPPYTTDELLLDASKTLGYTASMTMKLAQDLFESGFITYHRTDSIHVSNFGIEIAKIYINTKLKRPELIRPRNWGIEGTHEAIRPTNPIDASELRKLLLQGSISQAYGLSEMHLKLYDLIFRRFIASQMKSSKVLYSKATLRIGSMNIEIEEPVSIIKEGFTKVLGLSLQAWLLNVKKGDIIKVMKVTQRKGSAITLLTSGDVVKMMKMRGIGRPSTYVKAIENNKKHGYAIESKKRKYLIPTKLGIEISDILREYFVDIVGEEATRKLLNMIDHITRGKLRAFEALKSIWRKVIATMIIADRYKSPLLKDSKVKEEGVVNLKS